MLNSMAFTDEDEVVFSAILGAGMVSVITKLKMD
jgi:hypothetical protein